MQKSGGVPLSFACTGAQERETAHTAAPCGAQDEERIFILAGGTAALRSLVLETAERTLTEAGQTVERVCDAADETQLCGLEAPGLHAAAWGWMQIAGRAPACPGVGGRVLTLDDCLDARALQPSREKLLVFYARAAATEERARLYLAAAANLLSDTFRLALESADLPRLDAYAARLARRLFDKTHRRGTETLRRLTAVTAGGVQSFIEQTAAQYTHVYVLQDDCGLGRVLLARLRDAALEAGQDVISCPCALFSGERPEHLLLPGLSIGFFTSSHFHPVERYRRIHMRRFLDSEAFAASHARVTFNRRAAREMLRQASLLFEEAKQDRAAVQPAYDAATDRAAVSALSRRLADAMLSQDGAPS